MTDVRSCTVSVLIHQPFTENNRCETNLSKTLDIPIWFDIVACNI